MEQKRKFGWTEKGIIGWIFAPMGLLFLVLGILLSMLVAWDDPEDPIVFLATFGGMGAAFFLAGAILLYADIRKRSHMRQALEQGHYVMARIVGVAPRTNVNYNGSHPYVVECHYTDPDTGTVHVFYSRYLRFNPQDMITAEEVPVYLDRYDPKNVYVDIDAVLPEVKVH